MSLRLLHVSDLHFGPPYEEQVGEALMRQAHALAPDIVIASGDFTQRAKRSQFAKARAWLDRLPDVPVVVCPGNHDVPLYRAWERVRRPHRLYREYINEKLNLTYKLDGATIVSLDSTAPRQAITNGRVSRRQLAFAEAAFEDAPESDLRIVVAHHPFAVAPDYESGAPMARARRALDCFTRLRVDMLMGGHLHRAYVSTSLDIYPGKSVEHGILIVQSGTSTSSRGRAREKLRQSFNLVEASDDLISVAHYMYVEDSDTFLPTGLHHFPHPARPCFGPETWSRLSGERPPQQPSE